MFADSNNLLIVLIILLVLLLIVLLAAASKSKKKTKRGPEGSRTGRAGGGGSAGYGDGRGTTEGGGVYVDWSLREDGSFEDTGPGAGPVPEYNDSMHDIVRIYVDKPRTGLVPCPNCDTENTRSASRCIACGYILHYHVD